MNSCQFCGKSDFANSHSLRQHEYRHRHIEESEPKSNTPQHASIEPSDSEDIIERFQRGDIGEQSAVEEYEKQWVSQNPEPDLRHYREWSSRKANAVDAFRDKLVRAKPRISQVQNTQPVQRPLSVTEIAEQRARELRGEIPPAQAQAYSASAQARSFTPQEKTQSPQVNTPKPNPLGDLVAKLKGRFAPKEEKKTLGSIPLNERGLPEKQWICDTCVDYYDSVEITFHHINGHNTRRVS